MIFLGKNVLRGRGKHVSLKRGPIAERALKMFFFLSKYGTRREGGGGFTFFTRCARDRSVCTELLLLLEKVVTRSCKK